jgi:class II lanthipeptide synthase
MDLFHEHLVVRAATIDELLSDDFETLAGQKGDACTAAQRLAAWCTACASGDWSLFNRRLERDGLTIERVLARFATARRKVSVPPPTWIGDAVWIEAALQSPAANANPATLRGQAEPYAFEHLLAPVVEETDRRLSASVDATAFENLTDSARACLRALLRAELSGLFAAPLYERFAQLRKTGETPADASKLPLDNAMVQYEKFITEMRASGFRRLFQEKPVLLRWPRLSSGNGLKPRPSSSHASMRICQRSVGTFSTTMAVRSSQSRAISPIRTTADVPCASCGSRMGRALSTNQRICGSTWLGTVWSSASTERGPRSI